ncbi:MULTISPECIES: hypothetical protein [Streptomycetaceae]|uniref:hypothetical protein n=1 Tax=Streptomycetaceae TaxID=2062 RepID=UPI0030092F23
MDKLTSFDPGLSFLHTYLRARIDRVRNEDDLSRGASAVEWVVISAIVVAIVAAVGVIIKNALNSKANGVSNCIANTNGDNGC